MTGKKWISLLLFGVVLTICFSFFTLENAYAQEGDAAPLTYLANSNIVYLVSPTAFQSEDSTAAQIVTLLSPNLTIASTWDAVEELNAPEPIDALLIDVSAVDEVSAPLVSEAYWNGVVVAGINVPARQYAELIGNPCVIRDGFDEPFSGDFFISAAHITLGDNPTDTARIEEAYRRNCGSSSASNIRGHVISTSPRATNALESERDFTIFASVLNEHLSDISETYNDFTTGRLRQSSGR